MLRGIESMPSKSLLTAALWVKLGALRSHDAVGSPASAWRMPASRAPPPGSEARPHSRTVALMSSGCARHLCT